MKKSVLVSVVLGVVMVSLVGCSNEPKEGEVYADYGEYDEVSQTLETVSSLEEETKERETPQVVLEKFLEALREEEFHEARLLVYELEDNLFINDEMFEYIVKRCSFGWMVGNSDYQSLSLKESIKEKTATVELNFTKSSTDSTETTYKFTLKMDESGAWKVANDYFCCSDVLFATPRGVRFYLGDTEVPTTYKTKSDEAFDYYTVPLLPSYEYTTHIVSSVFGDIEGKMSIPADVDSDESSVFKSEYQVPNREITDEFFSSISARIKEIYDGVYNDMASKRPASVLSKYLSVDTDYQLFATDYELGMKLMSAEYNRRIDESISSPTVVKIIRNKSAKSYVYTDSKIAMNVGFVVSWKEGESTQMESFYTSMLLKYEGEFFVYEANSNSFTTFNNTLREFENNGEVW